VILEYIVATTTSVHVVSTVPFGHIVAFVIPLVELLMSLPVMWRKEHVWNLKVFQRVDLPIVLPYCIQDQYFLYLFINKY
jgi:ABC-type sulfate transport system permease component